MSFEEKARKVHGDKYSYCLVNYTNSKTKVTIFCYEHGPFDQTPNSHLNGSGCPKCGERKRHENKKLTLKDSIVKARESHGEKYDYSLVKYELVTDEVSITCPGHGPFTQIWINHYRGQGCPKCAIEERSESQTLTRDEFISRSRQVHGDKYDYTQTELARYRDKVEIVCPKHGSFLQSCENHYSSGAGCPECGLEQMIEKQSSDINEFTTKAREVHGGKYDYTQGIYVNSKTKLTIICPEHGCFNQTPNDHLDGHGCPKCGVHTSKNEEIICSHLDRLGVNYIRSDRSLIKPLEIDIYIPGHNLAVEYNGLRWHSEVYGKGKDYHKTKTDLCREKGVRLIHVWEDDFNRNQGLELAFLSHQLGSGSFNRVYARKTTVDTEINKQEVRLFLMKHHVQGYTHHTISIGLREEGDLVAVACFTRREGVWELVRYCTSKHVLGGLGKLMKAWNKSCYTFCDLSRFTGDSYVKAGFVKTSELKPDYRYVVNDERQHKFLWRKERIRVKLPEVYRPDLTEKQMMEAAGIRRIWDCGKVRYEYKP